jgi:hypothetical protein
MESGYAQNVLKANNGVYILIGARRMNLKEARVRCEPGEFLVVYLSGDVTKAIASCPECTSEMPIKPLPGEIERPQLDGLKIIARHGFYCNKCDNGNWWFTDGVEIDKEVLQIKVKDYASDKPEDDPKREDTND